MGLTGKHLSNNEQHHSGTKIEDDPGGGVHIVPESLDKKSEPTKDEYPADIGKYSAAASKGIFFTATFNSTGDFIHRNIVLPDQCQDVLDCFRFLRHQLLSSSIQATNLGLPANWASFIAGILTTLPCFSILAL